MEVYRKRSRENTFEEKKFMNKNRKKRKMKKQQYHSKAEDKIQKKSLKMRDNCIDLFLLYLVVIGHVMLCGYLSQVSVTVI